MDPTTLADLPRPTVTGRTLGAARVLAAMVLLLVGAVGVSVAAIIPVRRRGVRLAAWWAVALARAFLWTVGVRLEVTRREALWAHRGFVFFNHLAFLDPVVLMAVRPVRFLATLGVRRIPLVGWITKAVGTLFVNRGRDDSREQARAELKAAIERSPLPVALAPEGCIGPGPGVLPLRHGAFEVATDADADILLVAVAYDPPGYAVWEDESLLGPLWRLCARTVPFCVRLEALPPALETRPHGDAAADPEALAADATRRLDAVLTAGLRPRPVVT